MYLKICFPVNPLMTIIVLNFKSQHLERSKSRITVLFVYLATLVAGALLTYFLPGNDPLSKLFFIDVCMTILVFVISFKYNNASLYDPYWSVIPFGMLFYWVYVFGAEVISLKIIITSFIVSFWSWRLTANWLRGWQGLSHEDWRYRQLKQQTGKWYILVNFLGIHMFPTLVVFVASMPLYYIFMFSSEMNWVVWLGYVVALSGIILELTADNQLYKFKIKENNPIAVMRFGVWQYLRHPNYLGEILFWVGLMLISYTPYTTISVVSGSALVIALFVFVSVPLIDKRLLKTKPGYVIYKQSTWALIPRLPK
jgi:steroid 5-alpha reductase family enzyme